MAETLIFVGVVALLLAWRTDKTASLNEGSFALEILLILGGIGCLAIGGIIIGARLFTLSPSLLALIIVPMAVIGAGIVILNRATNPPASYIGMGLIFVGIAMVVFLLLMAMLNAAHARDDGRYANSALKPWFDSLRSGKGPCCSDADGTALSDVDWEAKDGHYRVRIEDQWWDVPDEAVIKEPNRSGRTMVWPIYYRALGSTVLQRVDIRCFIVGPMG